MAKLVDEVVINGNRISVIVKVALLRERPAPLIMIIEPLIIQAPTDDEHVVFEERVKLVGGVMSTSVLLELKEESIANGEVTVNVMLEF